MERYKILFVLTDTGWKFFWLPAAVSLAVGGLLADQLVAISTVIRYSTTERVAFASMPSMSLKIKLRFFHCFAVIIIRTLPGSLG